MAFIIVFKLKSLLLLKLHFIDIFFKLLETNKNLLKICSFLIVLSINSNLFFILKLFINFTKKWRIGKYSIIFISICWRSCLMFNSNIMANLQRGSYILITTFIISKVDSYKISITYNFSKDIQIIQGNLIEEVTIIFKVLVEN